MEEKKLRHSEAAKLSEEKLEFKRSLLILGNLGLLAWLLLAFLSVFLYNQVYGWLYLLSTGMILIILRRLGCSTCCYCKTCTSGFGRLAGVFFGTGLLKKGSVGNRLGLIVFIYFLLLTLPSALLFIWLSQTFSLLAVSLLTCLLAVSVYSLTTWRKS